MQTKRAVIASKNGIVLTEISLFQGTTPVWTSYVVTSQWTPQEWSFPSRTKAIAHFETEAELRWDASFDYKAERTRH